MNGERDLAEAIHHEIASEQAAVIALDIWQHRRVGASDRRDMEAVLAAVARHAIDTVLARRQREAARAGPWGDYEEEDGYPGSLVPRKRAP
jgi:hypothetical protein